jgi:hypothetical protein
MARVQAELALAQGRPEVALDALDRVPEPWPAPLAAELLRLRAQAAFAAGRILDGMRATEARVQLLGAAEERHAAWEPLVEALLAKPDLAVPADATPSERAWFELAQVLGAPDGDAATLARRAADWRERHPNHPGGEFLPEADAAAASAMAALAAGPADSIALLLPLSGRMQAAGRAVRDGFLAAALAELPERRPKIEILDTADLGAAAAYTRALELGAGAVAGPLMKEDVAALLSLQSLPVPTLALNSIAVDSPPAFLFQFALDPEQEARAVARRIARDGRVRGIALFPTGAWGERLHAAFTDEARAAGLELISVQFYDPAARDFSGPLRSALGRFGGASDRGPKGAPAVRRDGAAEALAGPQFAFLAATAASARALVPQVRYQMAYELPVYATSDALEPNARSVPDLEGVTYPEMPWILFGGIGAQELWDVLQTERSSTVRGRLRLYAFGFDAYGLLRNMNSAAGGMPVTGLSGRLTIAPGGHVQRELEWARVQGGQPEPAGAVPPPAVPGEP